MAIVFDAQVTGPGLNNTGTTLTWSHTTSGTNRALFVFPLIVSGSDLVTGVTYAGISMSKILGPVTIGGVTMYIYFLGNGPASGANNVVISTSSSISIFGSSISYTGVAQTNTPDGSTTAGPTTTTSLTASITTNSDNCWLVGFARNNATTMSVGANTFKRAQYDGNDGTLLVDTNSAQTPAGNYSLNVTATSSLMTMLAVSFAPASNKLHTLASLGAGS